MNKKTRLFNLFIIGSLFLGACNLPSKIQGEGLSLTAAAQTVEVLLSATPAVADTDTPLPFTATLTPDPQPVLTNTPLPPPTSSCNVMQFITDVTIPDGTIMTPGQAFTKTWRLKNIGTCAWTPSYAIAFSDGNAMSGPPSQALVGNVSSGQTIDISVNLTAPASTGDYTGNWKLRDGSGVLFGKFYVQIKVQNAATATNTLPPAVAQVVLTNIYAEGGQVRSDGTVLNPPNAGDTDLNKVAEAFASFDMTGIPAGATITKVVVDFSSGYDILGNPWDLGGGCLRAYPHNYGSVDAGDFVPGDPLGAVIAWCGSGQLSSSFESTDLKSAVQNAVGNSRLQLRIQFRAPTTDSDGVADMVRLGTMKLTVTYQ